VWLFALGALFVLVTLFLPKGIVGTVQQFYARRKEYSDAATKEKSRVAPIPTAVAEPGAAE
jgi:urea transport system permease protein